MLRVLGCITQEHDFRLLLLAGLICLFASFAALSLMRRSLHATSNRWAWLIAAAIVTGCGTWATHFVSMLAYQSGLPMGYDAPLTIMSIVIAILISIVGFAAARQRFHALGGAIVGFAVVAMHYIGMAALLVPADFQWDPVYVIASVVAGVGLGGLALWVGGSMHTLRSLALGALLLALAIVSLHFIAMTALTLSPNPTIAAPTDMVVAPGLLAIAVAAISILILGSGLLGSFADQQRAEWNAFEAARLRHHNEALEATQAQLEQTTLQLRNALAASNAASKAKSQFLANMSHELRTPLNAIIGFSEVMAREMLGPVGSPQYRQYAEHIFSSGTHLLQLINDVLDFSKVEAGRMELHEECMSIADVTSEAVVIIQQQAKTAGLSVAADVPEGLPRLKADRRRVLQILLNLLSNALKFTPAGGGIRIDVKRAEDALIVVVSDTGLGMKPEDIPVALESFRQLDNSFTRKHQGTGLGLPLCKQLMELHGGALRIESAPGKGTSVVLTFPTDRLVAESAKPAKTAA